MVATAGVRDRECRPRDVRASGTAPRGHRVRARADDCVDDGDQDRQDSGTTQATLRSRPVVPVPRGRYQRERHQGLLITVPAVFRPDWST